MGYTDLKELLKDARNFAEGANDLQLKGKLLDIQGEVYDLLDENRNLRIENEKLKNEQITDEQLYQNGVFWKMPGKEYMYCPKCWGKDKNLVVCILTENKVKQFYLCPVCKFASSIFENEEK